MNGHSDGLTNFDSKKPGSVRNYELGTMWNLDNFELLREMNSKSVDLIYLDPPFNKDKKFQRALSGQVKKDIVDYMDSISKKEPYLYDKWLRYVDENLNDIDEIEIRFDDAWKLNKVKAEQLEELRLKNPDMYKIIYAIPDDDTKAYLIFMGVRLIEMHRVLKTNGSLFLHCDYDANSYLRILLDLVFGRNNLRNEIVWCYSWAGSPKMRQFNRKHDTIYWYSKSDKWTFNIDDVRVPHKQLNPNRSNRGGGEPLTAELVEKYKEKGKVPETWWTRFSPVVRLRSERIGYPTQKPLSLLMRIIIAASNRGEVVFDPFAGCATALEAAHNLDRNWIGADISFMATVILRYRLHRNKDFFHICPYKVNSETPPKRTDRTKEETKKLITKLTYSERFKLKKQLFGEQMGTCIGCQKEYDFKIFEMDHKLPRSRGGQDTESNFQLLCGPCNKSKGDKTMEEWKSV